MMYKQRDPFEMVEHQSLELVFVIQRIKLPFDISSVSHASMFGWQEEQGLAYVRTYLTSAVEMDFYEDLKRWHEKQYRYQYDGRSFF